MRVLHKRRRRKKDGIIGARGIFIALMLYITAVTVAERTARQREAPDYHQQIAAVLVSWGHFPDGISPPVDPDEIASHIALLWSDIGEQRVQAAHWLTSRGVREAGPAIAAAMNDSGTYRPCQLAHDLGFLGDDRWVGLLADATKHPRNADLRMCATLALGELASPKAVNALIDAHRRGAASSLLIESIGKIGDPLALPFLRSVAKSPRNEFERRAVRDAIDRIEILQQTDPVPALISRVRDSARKGSLEAWAVRKLVDFQDKRAVPVLREVLMNGAKHRQADRVILTAALLAHKDPGIVALKDIVAVTRETAPNISSIAQAALSLHSQSIIAKRHTTLDLRKDQTLRPWSNASAHLIGEDPSAS